MNSIINRLATYGAVPNQRQMQWYRRGKAAFIHFSMNTFTGNEWGDGTDSPRLFNPTQLDCRQWMRILKNSGFTAAILTAKHHDGFCLWQSKYTDYSVKNSPYRDGKGDIVREFTDACREYDMKAGIYLSPWDRNYPEWGTEKYNEYYANQLTELMTGYGEICECWWDGAGSTEAVYDWKRWVEIIRRNQPECVIFGSLGATPYVDIRWAGNELGRAGKTCFATIDESSLETETTKELNSGKADGERFIPAECNTSIRPGWFYHSEQDSLVKTAGQLTEYWFTSVGRNGGILLNIPPDKRGIIHENDAQSLMRWEENLNRIFNVNIAEEADISSSVKSLEDTKASNLISADDNKIYICDDLMPEITFAFKEPITFNCFRIDEVIELGHRVRGFSLDIMNNAGWHTVAERECIGFCHCEHFDKVTTDRVRFRITKSADKPVLRFFGLFSAPEDVFADECEKSDDVTDLAAQPGAKILNEDGALVIELGGIFPYNTVIFNGDGLEEYEILVFNGTRYEFAYYGVNGTNHDVCRFATAEGSYKLKISPICGKIKDGVIPQIYYIK